MRALPPKQTFAGLTSTEFISGPILSAENNYKSRMAGSKRHAGTFELILHCWFCLTQVRFEWVLPGGITHNLADFSNEQPVMITELCRSAIHFLRYRPGGWYFFSQSLGVLGAVNPGFDQTAESLFFSRNSVGVMRRDVLAKEEWDALFHTQPYHLVSLYSLHGQRHTANSTPMLVLVTLGEIKVAMSHSTWIMDRLQTVTIFTPPT